MLWRYLLRPLFFRLEPETAHYMAMGGFHAAAWVPGVLPLLRWQSVVHDPRLRVNALGLEFPSPLGLAAGFDKDARWFNELAALGFGHVEVGTLTAYPQPGNPRPRLFRLPADQALINRMGFNNRGSAEAASRLGRTPKHTILGINLGKSKVTPLEEATTDYLTSLERLFLFADYFTVNVSSPNTPGLRQLQDREPLTELLSALVVRNDELAQEKGVKPRPILLKVAPDLTEPQLDDIAELLSSLKLSGVIATNTTIERQGLQTSGAQVEQIGAGGLSGRPLAQRSREVVRFLYERLGGQMPIIGVGGVFSADDLWELMACGASLVQVYTGFIYEGPGFVRRLHHDLLTRMQREQVGHVSEIVGTRARVS